MILSKLISVPNDCRRCNKHLNSFILNLLMVFNSIFGFPLDNVNEILKYMSFRDTLKGADLRWADLRWADLRWAALDRVNLRGADLWGAYLQGAILAEEQSRIARDSGAIMD